jgi:hypothetical protein
MKKAWMSTAAGILDISGGTLGIICGHLALQFPETGIASFLFYIALLAMGGGIFSIRREMWSLALVGCIGAFLLLVSLMPSLPDFWEFWQPDSFPIPFDARIFLFLGASLGVAAIVLTALSKDEFK